jgi:hypothetical protein
MEIAGVGEQGKAVYRADWDGVVGKVTLEEK